ncbi:hypothetical protein [Vibrio anguillarum]|uniref:hypothetical protein n=1 Tax=Vibrio anguillarum TaxID=55601 RepID=UPI0002EC4BDD|nr:hypothetical protein [Vibrio anguillarum]OEE50309.1 hypothetical protein A1QU_11405 [Vibrio anguillarum]
MSQIESSKKIYSQLQLVVDELVKKLSTNSRDVSTHKHTQEGREVLGNLRDQIHEQLSILDKYAEWDTYTIALYGETNAGKSTIIETLRILLGEEGKKQSQVEFKEWQQKNGVTKEVIRDVRQLILNTESELDIQKNSLKELSLELDNAISERENVLNEKKQQWEELANSASFLKRIWWLVQTAPELKSYKEAQQALEQAHSVKERKIQESVDHIEAITLDISNHRAKHDEMIEQVSQAESLADGAIIGNGRSDFTLETQSYRFERDGHKFNLLDVPGIEGKESKVSDAIWQAVHKAHAVFYITGKASAPQKGDGKNPGTLDKIKQHLGAQSEVWTVFNKRIQNPIQIKNRDLVSAGEEESLKVLNTTMKDYLGDSYQSYITLSAYPAFLAASSCLLPASRDENNQDKFLDQFSQQALLEKSNINAIAEMFNESTVSTFKDKILRSNRNKAREVVAQATKSVSELYYGKFAPLLAELNQELEHSSAELNSHMATLRSRLRNKAAKQIRDFGDQVRIKTYDQIDNDISNDEFERQLQYNVEHHQSILIDNMPGLMSKEIEKFEERLNETLARFQDQTRDVMGNYNSLNNIDTNININIDNGVNVWGILGAVGGGLVLLLNPVGWGVIAISVASLVFQVYKALRSMFSSNYKRSQQRKSTNENIDNCISKIQSNIDKTIDGTMDEIKVNVNKITDAMSESIQHIRDVNSKLSQSKFELNKLLNELEY